MLATSRNIISSDATTQEMIAPVIDTLIATKAWLVGEEFIYAGTLYKVISAIAIGDTIVLGSGGNADTASTVSEEAYRINDTDETDIQDGDYFPFYDVSASKKKRSLFSNIKAKLKTYFDTLYLAKVTLATVATSGNYSDLTGKPTIPTVNNGTLTIQRNGTNVATFTANQSSNATANISVPVNQSAASGGTTVSACTTGEKYIWNNKSNSIISATVTYTANTTISAQTGKEFSINVAKSGYTPLGVVLFGKSGAASGTCYFAWITMTSPTVSVYLYNAATTGSSTITTIVLSVLYRAN